MLRICTASTPPFFTFHKPASVSHRRNKVQSTLYFSDSLVQQTQKKKSNPKEDRGQLLALCRHPPFRAIRQLTGNLPPHPLLNHQQCSLNLWLPNPGASRSAGEAHFGSSCAPSTIAKKKLLVPPTIVLQRGLRFPCHAAQPSVHLLRSAKY